MAPRSKLRRWANGVVAGGIALLSMIAAAPSAHGQTDAAIARGVAFLKQKAPAEKKLGETALATLALLKVGQKSTDPVVGQLLARVASSAAGGVYRPAAQGGVDNYEAAVVLLTLSAADPEKYYFEIQAVANYLIAKQTPSGAWDYGGGQGGTGDTSMSQYGILALWDAASIGVEVPMEVWDRAMNWLITRQDTGGGFTYHPRAPDGDSRVKQGSVTHSMSVAGAGSLIICRSQLPLVQPPKRVALKDRELLIPVESKAEEKYVPLVTKEKADEAIELAQRWMTTNITVTSPTGPLFYYLYGLERYASFAELKKVGAVDWYPAGSQTILSKQDRDGSWKGTHQPIVDTSFALLFLGRSTEKTLARLRVSILDKGTLVGGRGLPTTEMPDGLALRQKARYRQALKAPVEELLAALDDPEATNVEAAAAAMETIEPDKLVQAVGGNKSGLRKLTRDERPAVRRAALWGLARTKDLRVAPLLIRGLSDPDPQVYLAARDSLRFLSRRVDGFGLPDKIPERDKLLLGIRQWTTWFEAQRLQVDADQQYDD